MLISFEDICNVLLSNNITVTGVLHVGAHNCEELPFYEKLNLKKTDIVWVDALPFKVQENIAKGIPNVYNAVMSDKDDEDTTVNITNNVCSSSVLELGTHKQEHPDVVYIGKIHEKSITVDTFFSRNNLDASKYNFWNFDVQGAELLVLKGALQSIKHVKVMCLEVNEKELYKKCALIGEIDDLLCLYKFKRVITAMTQHGWGDAVYVRQS